MDLISALETSFKVVERLEDRRLAMDLYAAARQLNDLFVSPERLARYAALMRNGALKTRDTIALARELNDSRATATRALSHLQRITYQQTSVFGHLSWRRLEASVLRNGLCRVRSNNC